MSAKSGSAARKWRPTLNVCHQGRFAAILALLPLVSAQSDSVPIPTCPAADKYLDISSLNCLVPAAERLRRRALVAVHRRRADVRAGGRSSTAAAWSSPRARRRARADARRHAVPAVPGRAEGGRHGRRRPPRRRRRRRSRVGRGHARLDAATGDCVRRRQGAVERDALGALLPAKSACRARRRRRRAPRPVHVHAVPRRRHGGDGRRRLRVRRRLRREGPRGRAVGEGGLVHARAVVRGGARFASSSSYSVDFRDVVTENCLAFQYGPTSSQCSSAARAAAPPRPSPPHLRPAPPPRRHRVPAGRQVSRRGTRDQPLNDGNEACQTLGNLTRSRCTMRTRRRASSSSRSPSSSHRSSTRRTSGRCGCRGSTTRRARCRTASTTSTSASRSASRARTPSRTGSRRTRSTARTSASRSSGRSFSSAPASPPTPTPTSRSAPASRRNAVPVAAPRRHRADLLRPLPPGRGREAVPVTA